MHRPGGFPDQYLSMMEKEDIRTGALVRIPAGYGYWDILKYGHGGDFRRSAWDQFGYLSPTKLDEVHEVMVVYWDLRWKRWSYADVQWRNLDLIAQPVWRDAPVGPGGQDLRIREDAMLDGVNVPEHVLHHAPKGALWMVGDAYYGMVTQPMAPQEVRMPTALYNEFKARNWVEKSLTAYVPRV